MGREPLPAICSECLEPVEVGFVEQVQFVTLREVLHLASQLAVFVNRDRAQLARSNLLREPSRRRFD
jgi:hypothetical protein